MSRNGAQAGELDNWRKLHMIGDEPVIVPKESMMKPLRVVVFAAFIVVVLVGQPIQAAYAATYFYDQTYLGGGSCSGGGFFSPVNINWAIPAGGTIKRQDNGTPTSSGFVSGTGSGNANLGVIGPIPAIPYTYIIDYFVTAPGGAVIYRTRVIVTCRVGNVLGMTILNNFGSSSGASEVPPPKFFDPGDIRVDGWPGDRIAVYCPSDKQIQVIGIGADGSGAGVAVFNPKDVITAGKAGLSVLLRSYKDPKVNLGVVTIQMTLNDGVTSIYIAWNGGILNATGQGDFKKMFVTPIRFCPFTFR